MPNDHLEVLVKCQWKPVADHAAASKVVREFINAANMGATEWYRRREGTLRYADGHKHVGTVHYNGRVEVIND